MIADLKKIKDTIFDIKNGKIKEGLKINVPELDEYLRLKYTEGSMNLCIGHSNCGKTTLLVYLLTVWAVRHNLRFLIFSSENTPHSILRKIIEFKMNEPINTASDAKIEKSMQWADQHFKIINADKIYTYAELLKEAQQVKQAWDYHGLMIDPYNSLGREQKLAKSLNGYEYNYHCLTELRLFSRQNKIAIWVNCHGQTDALRKLHPVGHRYEGQPRELRMADVEGGGAFGNRADDVISVDRKNGDKEDWMFTFIHVLKIKEIETGGRCTSFNEPIKLRMCRDNCGFEIKGRNILHDQPVKRLLI